MLSVPGTNPKGRFKLMALTSKSTLAQPFLPVKSSSPAGGFTTANPMIHHNVPSNIPGSIIVTYKSLDRTPYGVSPAYRVLSPQLLLKKYDQVRDCLVNVLKLTTAEREVTLRLLRFWAYYGYVYPKASTVTTEPGCSKATFWRTVALLERLNLIRRINRYVVRPHAQISNLYRLDRLIVLLARYLAEHGVRFLEKWLEPYLSIPGRLFWTIIWRTPAVRAGPA